MASQDPNEQRPTALQGPVTRLSRVGGIAILLLGLALTDIGGHFVGYAAASSPTYAGIGIFIGFAMVTIGIVEILAGIGILLSKTWGRFIGISCSLLLGGVSFQLAVVDGSIAWKDAPTWLPAAPNAIVFGSVVVLYALSAITLMFRWRRPGQV